MIMIYLIIMMYHDYKQLIIVNEQSDQVIQSMMCNQLRIYTLLYIYTLIK
jgi:hypothetical protein|eukprot:COSAG06_NODE_2872_length_6143_cov_2.234088_3_plen_50_part_00